MKKINCIILLICISVAASAQNFSIIGKVVDSANGQPLSKASAFCQNTTFGTVTNNDGLFYLNLPNGGYDLVISYTGYEKKLQRISNTQSNKDTIVFVMAPLDNSMEQVAVVASNEVADGWNKYGKFFTDNFIGTTPNAGECVIQNPEALRFFYTKKRNRLKVTAKEDVVVVNNALGYKIRYQLDSFSYDYNNNVSQYTGYPFFEEMDSTEDVKTDWEKNRAKTYLGSRLHFMRALYDSMVVEEGFMVEKMDKGSRSTTASKVENIYDTANYYVDTSGVIMSWNGRYRVSYTKVHPDKKFLAEYKLPLNTVLQVTLLNIADIFVIEQNGYFYDQYDVVNSGYWAWKKLAETLPYNYEYQ
ncbi:MAG: carboxypeptidase-like regulatory domain-containing protein [Chitinophagaceae bacterium]|nr:MAG: carboxypeptidase-like regulatory domain-containing protein [Chitinophagaceae bacterium]